MKLVGVIVDLIISFKFHLHAYILIINTVQNEVVFS